jgi:hypothetical protein
MRSAVIVIACCLLGACSGSKQVPETKEEMKPLFDLKITQFYSDPAVVRGADGKANLCYGVEGAAKVTLDPPVEDVWPAMVRCFEVSPKVSTTYTLTAESSTGQKVSQKTMIQVGPPTVKIVEVSINSLTVKPGEAFPFCVRAVNAASWKLSAGAWRNPPDSRGGCAVDYPKQTTTYVITAVGAMGETDSERVTATVQP